jgi:starvation-inducible DNA-binding protein
LRDGIGHVAALTERGPALATTTREAMDAAARAGDADTADLLTGTSRVLVKGLWMLKAHLD